MYLTPVICVFNGITSDPVNAHPFVPAGLPPVALAPGTPAPLYCWNPVNHPLIVLVGPGNPGVGDENPPVSIVVPGAATHKPDIPVDPVVNIISKLAKLGLTNAKVKYCNPDRPVAKSGPIGN